MMLDIGDMPPAPPMEAYEDLRTAGRDRFKDLDADTLVYQDGLWVVKGLWPLVGLCFVVGPSGSGKSFWLIHQIAMIAVGEPVLGRRSLQGGVIYLGAEGANGVMARFHALRQTVGPWNGAIRFIGEAPNLFSETDVPVLRKRLGQIKGDLHKRGHPLRAVVVDTLSASIPGADENSAQDMSKVLAALQSMAVALETCVIVVAHHGKDADRGIRGWSGQHANADGVIALQAPTEDETRVGQVVKVKDGECGEKFAFGLDVVHLGTDADGDPITSCVISGRTVPAKTKGPRSYAGPGAAAETILKAFDRIEERVDVSHLPGAPKGTYGVGLDHLRSTVFDMGFHDETQPESNADEKAMKAWREARKKQFQRAMEKLVNLRTIRKEQGLIWCV